MKKRIVLLFIGMLMLILLLPSCAVWGKGSAAASTYPSFEMIAHRGFDAEYPEDTIYAAQKAMSLGANPECDVQFTKDGEMVVIHDDTVDRTTDGTGKVVELPYSYIESLDAGSYLSDSFAGTKIPKFTDYLAAVKDAVRIYPEIKAYRDLSDVDTFTQALLDAGYEDKATIQSFDYPNVLPEIRRLSSKVCVGALCSTQEAFDANLETAKKDPNTIMLISAKIADADNLTKCRDAGIDVAVWTVKTEDQLKSLLELGYDKLMLSKYIQLN